MEIKTVFKDAIGPDTVPKQASGGKKEYDAVPAPGLPGRDRSSNGMREVTYDNVAKDPSTKGPIKTLYKDAVG